MKWNETKISEWQHWDKRKNNGKERDKAVVLMATFKDKIKIKRERRSREIQKQERKETTNRKERLYTSDKS